jgi:hypothetical protein
MACNTSLTSQYQVAATGSDVTLSVSIGFGKTAVTVVSLNDVPIPGPGPNGTFTGDFTTVIKDVKDGDELMLTTAVGDTNIGSPNSSVEVGLSGGSDGNSNFPVMSCDDIANGAVDYDTSILFYS